MPRPVGTQTTAEMERDLTVRGRPWTTAHYESLRQEVLGMFETHISWDRANGETRPSFDGHTYWRVLGALDRMGSKE